MGKLDVLNFFTVSNAGQCQGGKFLSMGLNVLVSVRDGVFGAKSHMKPYEIKGVFLCIVGASFLTTPTGKPVGF